MISKVKKTHRKVISKEVMLGSAWVALLRMRQMGVYKHNNKEWLPEINALRRNHDDIVGAM